MNLIFDGNYILYKNVFTLNKLGVLYGELENSLTNNILKYYNKARWENLIIVSDSGHKSWRDKLIGEYKGKRVKNEDINWTFVFEQYDAWKEYMKNEYSAKIYEYDGIEGDDFIASNVRYYNKQNKSNVVIANDGDLLQLVKYRLDDKFKYINIQVNDHNFKEKIYIPEGYEIILNSFKTSSDFTSGLSNVECAKFIEHLLDSYSTVEVNGNAELFKKIVQGDTSDNISSIYITEAKNGSGKLMGIGKRTAEKMWDFYSENITHTVNTKDVDFIDNVILSIEKIKKVEIDDIKREEVESIIKRNIQLIQLTNSHFPNWVNDEIINQITTYEK